MGNGGSGGARFLDTTGASCSPDGVDTSCPGVHSSLQDVENVDAPDSAPAVVGLEDIEDDLIALSPLDMLSKPL